MPLTHRIAPFLPPALVEAIETVAGAAQRRYRKLPRPWRQQVEALLDWAVESGALHAAVLVLLTVILLDVLLRAAHHRPAASASASSSPPAPPPADRAQGAALPPRPTGHIAPPCLPHRPCLPLVFRASQVLLERRSQRRDDQLDERAEQVLRQLKAGRAGGGGGPTARGAGI